jgi:nucleotide-binding universal stress UspA family protein
VATTLAGKHFRVSAERHASCCLVPVMGIGSRGRRNGMLDRTLVVCPVDASNPKGRAAVLAVALARFLGGGLHLLLVSRGGEEPIPEHVREWLAEPAGDKNRIRLRRLTVSTDPAQAIARYASREGAAVVVVDARYGEAGRWRRCSPVARRLARSASCSVMVVPAEGASRAAAVYPPFRDLVCAVDFSPASVAASQAALALARGARSRLVLVHSLPTDPFRMVFSGGEALDYLHEYEARAAEASARLMRLVPVQERGVCRVEPFVISGPPHHMIVRVASEAKADLIVMGPTPRTAAEELLAGSTSAGVLRRASCPVLLVRGPIAATEGRPALFGWETGGSPQRIAAMAGRAAVGVDGSVAALH